MATLPDQQDRDLALDVSDSFIVQAPAGSGKTELLSLRYLSLLSICREPEEVLAITFTRKAASEMKDRIIRALQNASDAGPAPAFDNQLDERRYLIAHAALQRAEQCRWNILENPTRLRIQTIDSFCFNLASRIPLLSQLGSSPNISDDVQLCFDAAISNTLATLNDAGDLADDIAQLLTHLDNDVSLVERLLSSLLGNRDQWLPYILDIPANKSIDREYLQLSLQQLINESLGEVHDHLIAHQHDVVELLNHAAIHLPQNHRRYIEDYQPLSRLPDCEPESIAYWLLLEAILLTKTDASWRSRIDKRDGFPSTIEGDKQLTADCKQRKALWTALLEKLQDDQELQQALAYLRLLPDPALEDQQWEFLTALARILRNLSAQLQLSFRKLKLVDHVQVSAAALEALGSEQEPTDLALALDHRIQHILVDEFQDTSRMQSHLLRQLTAGWEPEDGRTLFLVGDAMQSVYGFRNANVGIYLNAREEGIGSVPLHPLVLQSNFRSQSNIVKWVNSVFKGAFPAHSNSSRGAVHYTPSIAHHEAIADQGVTTELISCDRTDRPLALRVEARRLAARVQLLQDSDPDASIAILVRNRSHLTELIPQLREAGIHWQATDIDRLDSLPVIDDLQSLTRAILNPGDRIAWLAILRAPWCGLPLADLHALAQAAEDRTIWSALQKQQEIAELSADGRDRLAGITKVLSYALAMREKFSLHRIVESAWTLLRGAAMAISEAEQDSVAFYLELLSKHERGGTIRDFHEFAETVARSFIPSQARSGELGAVHLLTMHKAKGLEFDHVILPTLGADSRNNDKSLLQWHERLNQHGESRLFIAALSSSGADDDPLYKLLRFEEKRKAEFEDVRLLYIATTRARKSAHLSAVLVRNSAGEAAPRKGSLLHYIWIQLQEMGSQYSQSVALEELPETTQLMDTPVKSPGAAPEITPIQRFDTPLQLTEDELHFIDSGLSEEESTLEQPDDNSLNETDRKLKAKTGTVIHQALENLAKSPLLLSEQDSLANLQNYWRMQLKSVTTDSKAIDEALRFIQTTLEKCLADKQTAWLFKPDLQDSRAEAAISRSIAGRLQHFTVDRTFIDKEGVRWIVDYKTTSPEGSSDIEAFIEQQCQLHTDQLANYRKLFEQIESRPIRTALLFTDLPRLVEIK